MYIIHVYTQSYFNLYVDKLMCHGFVWCLNTNKNTMKFQKTERFHEETVKTTHCISINFWPPRKSIGHGLSMGKP